MSTLSVLVAMFCAVQASLLADILYQLPAPYERMHCVVRTTPAQNDRRLLEEIFSGSSELTQYQVFASSSYFYTAEEKCTHYLIIIDDLSWPMTDDMIANFFLSMGWNPRGYFIFLSESPTGKASLQRFNNLVHNFGVTNAVLIIWDYVLSRVTCYGYDYFERASVTLETIVSVMEHLQKDYLRDVRGDVFRASVTPLYPYIIINYERFEINGSFALLLKIFSAHINATMDWHLAKNETTPEEYLQGVSSDTIDIIPYRIYEHFLIDLVIEPEIDGIFLLLPEQLNSPFFNNLLYPFSSIVWIVILVLFVGITLLNYKFKKYFQRNLLLAVFFGSKVAEHHLKRTERFSFISLSILVFLLTESYLAIMISYMLNVEYKDHLETISELEQISTPICIATISQLDDLREAYSATSEALSSRIVHKNEYSDWFNDQECSWLLSQEAGEQFVESRYNYDEVSRHKKFYILPQRVYLLPKIHAMSRKRPFTDRFILIQNRLFEAGFWQYCSKQKTLGQAPKWNTKTTFDFWDLLSLWYILCYGFTLSALAFVGEILFTYIVCVKTRLFRLLRTRFLEGQWRNSSVIR